MLIISIKKYTNIRFWSKYAILLQNIHDFHTLVVAIFALFPPIFQFLSGWKPNSANLFAFRMDIYNIELFYITISSIIKNILSQDENLLCQPPHWLSRAGVYILTQRNMPNSPLGNKIVSRHKYCWLLTNPNQRRGILHVFLPSRLEVFLLCLLMEEGKYSGNDDGNGL